MVQATRSTRKNFVLEELPNSSETEVREAGIFGIREKKSKPVWE